MLAGDWPMAFTTICSTAAEAVAGIEDGASVMVGGFGPIDAPSALLEALGATGARNLTLICNGPTGRPGMKDSSLLVELGQVSRVICSFPVGPRTGREMTAFERLYRDGQIELELVPQGTLAERIRAGGAGIGGFYTPTGVGTEFAEGKEVRSIDGQDYLLEFGLRADYALVRAHRGDRLGNLVYRLARRNFNPAMANAGRVTIAEVGEIVEPGELDPDAIVTPGLFVQRLVARPAPTEKPPAEKPG
jgi:3-oxoadipate CoA-transferase, alpha subunit